MKSTMALRMSLSFLWVFTGISSQFLAKDIGYEVLGEGGITGVYADICILSGSLLDIIIGLWILTGKHMKICYLAQMSVIVVYSVILTFIDPSFWIHPFGPLTKNIPILVILYSLYRFEKLA